jgi:hypothetical protein
METKAKELYTHLYSKLIEKGQDATIATKNAALAFKKLYSNTKEWQINDLSVKKTITKSSSGTNVHYYMDGIVTLAGTDCSNIYNNVSENLLSKFTQHNFIEEYGTIDHCEFDKDLKSPLSTDIVKGKEPALLDSIKLDKNQLHIRFKLNPKYPDYKKLLELQKQGHYLKLSAEFKDALTYNNTIIDASKLGWTLTSSPANKNAKIYNIEKKIE